jgi:transcriptional regulator GlxA family with amidase domain
MKKNVAILLFDEVEVLDFAGPFEVFAVADELHRREIFHTFTLALKPGTVRTRSGLKITPDFTLENCPAPQIIVIPGGAGTRSLLHMPALHEWLRVKSRTAELVMSVCTGALVLARAGLLDGLKATTHHLSYEELRQLAPNTEVIEGERFIDNGHLLTAAGIAAGIDCSLHIVARLLGEDAAVRTAEHMEYRRG